LAAVIDRKKTISIAIESETDVGSFLHHPLLQLTAVLWLERVESMVR
jgi:hypothetical protein